MTWQSRDLQFAADHPVAAGHFPGNPIIPGALLLDEVVRAVAGAGAAVVIQSAKFFRPVRPGETVLLRWEARGDGAIAFECALAGNGGLAAAGMLGPCAHD